MKLLGKNLITSTENDNVLKAQLESAYEHIAKEIKIKSSCQWHERGEKFTKFFFNLENATATKSTTKMLENNCEEIIDQKLIEKALENFSKTLF